MFIICFQLNPIILIVHSLHNTDAYQLLPYLHNIIITGARSNIKSLVTLLEYFKYSKSEKERAISDFNANTDIFQHFCFDIDNHSLTKLETVDSLCSKPSQTRKPVQKVENLPSKISDLLLTELNDAGKAKAIYFLILQTDIKNKIDPKDLSIVLKKPHANKTIKISLVDYLDSVTSSHVKGAPAPTLSLRLFHSHVMRRVFIPCCFVVNTQFKHGGRR